MSFNRTLFAEKLSTLKQTADSVCAVAQYAIYHRGKAETVKAVIELWLSGLRTADRKRHVYIYYVQQTPAAHSCVSAGPFVIFYFTNVSAPQQKARVRVSGERHRAK